MEAVRNLKDKARLGVEWDAFAEESDDAWFWHTTHYMDYAAMCSGDSFVANVSFSIFDNNEVVAICPLIVLRGSSEFNHFSFGGSSALPIPLPFPAIKNGSTQTVRDRVLACYVKNLGLIAVEHDVGHVSIRIPCLARSFLGQKLPSANPLLKHGFMDLAYVSQVIDLRMERAELWSDIRKGHKSDIKKAEQVCGITVWNEHNITDEVFENYRRVHFAERGGESRPEESFSQMLGWIENGHAILVEASCEGTSIGFSLAILFDNRAYYGSACRDPEFKHMASSHLIQWSTIKWLQEHSIEFYDLGPQRFHNQWFETPNPRGLSVARFKRGFGGNTLPVITAEHFYSKSLLQRTFERRLTDFLDN